MMKSRCRPLSPWEERINRAFVAFMLVAPFIGTLWALWATWRGQIAVAHWVVMFIGFALTQIGAGLGLHRLFSHRSFQPKRPLWVFLAWMGTLAHEGPLLWWVACHRLHHRKTDLVGDVHSPHARAFDRPVGRWRAFFHGYYWWLADWSREAVQMMRELRGAPVDPGLRPFWKSCSDLSQDEHLRWLTKNYALVAALGVVMNGVIGYCIEPTLAGFVKGYVVGGVVRLFLQHHSFAFVNSFCHLLGEKRFKSADDSRNLHGLSLWTFGESLHNNHHAHPWSASNRTRWYDLDLNYAFLRLFALCGLVESWKEYSEAPRPAGETGLIQCSSDRPGDSPRDPDKKFRENPMSQIHG